VPYLKLASFRHNTNKGRVKKSTVLGEILLKTEFSKTESLLKSTILGTVLQSNAKWENRLMIEKDHSKEGKICPKRETLTLLSLTKTDTGLTKPVWLEDIQCPRSCQTDKSKTGRINFPVGYFCSLFFAHL
jgi:hypothetical protein